MRSDFAQFVPDMGSSWRVGRRGFSPGDPEGPAVGHVPLAVTGEDSVSTPAKPPALAGTEAFAGP